MPRRAPNKRLYDWGCDWWEGGIRPSARKRRFLLSAVRLDGEISHIYCDISWAGHCHGFSVAFFIDSIWTILRHGRSSCMKNDVSFLSLYPAFVRSVRRGERELRNWPSQVVRAPPGRIKDAFPISLQTFYDF